MTQTNFPPEQIEEWKADMEENGDPEVDVYFHKDTPQEEPDKDSNSEGDKPQEETEVIPEE